MNENGRSTFLSRLAGGRLKRSSAPSSNAVPDRESLILAAQHVSDEASVKRSGDTLEQAYRDLLVENQMLLESNKRLHERLARRDIGSEDSPATRELVRAQREALAERSHRLREIEYENKCLQRKQKKLYEENQRLAKHVEDIRPLLRREELSRLELEKAKAELREKSGELAKLTDKYYQLQARTKPQPPPSSAANGSY